MSKVIEWIKVTERLPDNYAHVLFVAGYSIFYGIFREYSSGHTEWRYFDTEGFTSPIAPVTHWCIPQLPENY